MKKVIRLDRYPLTKKFRQCSTEWNHQSTP